MFIIFSKFNDIYDLYTKLVQYVVGLSKENKINTTCNMNWTVDRHSR